MALGTNTLPVSLRAELTKISVEVSFEAPNIKVQD